MREEIGILGYCVYGGVQRSIETVESRVGGACVANNGVGFILRGRRLSSVTKADKVGGGSWTWTYSADIWTLTILLHLLRRFGGTRRMRSTQQ